MEVVFKYNNSEYELGKSDCITFVIECVKSITGIDLSKGIVGEYNSNFSLAKFIKEKGDISHQANKLFGKSDSNNRTAVRGDILEVISIDGENTLAICDGEYALHKDRNGISRVDMDNWNRVWHL